MHRKIIFYLLTSLVFLGFSCTASPSKDRVWREVNGKLKVLTTTGMIHDLVSQIGGDNVDSLSLIKGELDPHSYELVKGDDEKFARADLIFYNGLGLEHGFSLRKNLQMNPKAISISESILKEKPNLILTVDGQYDPHIWMDISLWRECVDPIVNALSMKDPHRAESYRLRGEIVKIEMGKEDVECQKILQSIPKEKRFLVTSHDAFNYFTRHYLAEPGEEDWTIRCSAPEGLAPDAQMSVADILEVISHIEKYHISVLFSESNVSKDSLNKIVNAAKERGIKIRLCEKQLYGDSMGRASSYLAMIRHNVETVAGELNKP